MLIVNYHRFSIMLTNLNKAENLVGDSESGREGSVAVAKERKP